MAQRIDYYFTPVSPWAFLGSERFHSVAVKAGAEIAYKPVNFGTIFPASGGLPLAKRAPQRQAYRQVELRRWADHLGIPLQLNPTHFPLADELAALTLIAADEAGADLAVLTTAFGRALWVEDRNIADRETLGEILEKNGVSRSLIERAESDEIRARRDSYTEQALAAGVFGAPSYVLNGEIYWGQDRLDFLESALG
ncbi:2-hydroxychromene-2-carboxylate isomerase [Skermanella aerolata]|uniref:2-hydroxychromene-2-carboxylate isomerase n=1 Tax=Skermanella aerolata TaxID=393310 RepID=A0A512DQN5_9PROT|nr:2-hydroxychromene-2-carboxylate isomerase [Skermanella aerolata]KJB95363.1 DSBA oxidoreductase [Skermanella aerolata KACC 11604]GEO38755.1 2-hydroxychromene-2-carboxylate isomerase [Skermanella aerolata]